MKQLFSILCLLILVSCSNDVKEVDINLTENKEGIVYDFSDSPHNLVPLTGILVEYFENGQLEFKVKHKQSGVEKYCHAGYSWTYFFFGFFCSHL